MGDQSRLPVPLHLLRLGLGDRRQGHKFGDGPPDRRGRLVRRQKIEYIFCCDANFGIQKRDVDIAEYVAKIKQETGYPRRLSVQNTKNATERAYRRRRSCPTPASTRAWRCRCRASTDDTLEAIKRDNISLEHLSWSCSAASPATRSKPIAT